MKFGWATRARKLSGWVVWVGVPDADIQNPLHRALWRLSALGAALTILTLGVAYWLRR